MLAFGLTGGIGCGKSTVAKLLREEGFTTFDLDRLGHDVLEFDSTVAQEIAQKLPICVGHDGRVDRHKLGQHVFAKPPLRRWLEELVHPAIIAELLARVQNLPRPWPLAIILEGAIFLEARVQFELAGMILVACKRPIRVQRIKQRDGFSTDEIEARMSAQLPDWQKIIRADFVIDNAGGLQDTKLQVTAMVEQLGLEMGGGRNDYTNATNSI